MSQTNSLSPDDSASLHGQGCSFAGPGVSLPGSVDFIGKVAEALVSRIQGYDPVVLSKLTGEDLKMYMDRVDAAREKTQSRACALAHAALRSFSPSGSAVSSDFSGGVGSVSHPPAVTSARGLTKPRSLFGGFGRARSLGALRSVRSSQSLSSGSGVSSVVDLDAKNVGWCYLDLVQARYHSLAASLGSWPTAEAILRSPAEWFDLSSLSLYWLKGSGSRVHVVPRGRKVLSALDQLSATASSARRCGHKWAEGMLGCALLPPLSKSCVDGPGLPLFTRVGGIYDGDVDGEVIHKEHWKVDGAVFRVLMKQPGCLPVIRDVPSLELDPTKGGPKLFPLSFGDRSPVHASGTTIHRALITTPGDGLPVRVAVERDHVLVIPAKSVSRANSVYVGPDDVLLRVVPPVGPFAYAAVDVAAPGRVHVPVWVLGREQCSYTTFEAIRTLAPFL